MANISDLGSGLDICNVSPSDQAGQINNLMDRVSNLEIAVAKLAGLDVTATNASDLVESIGLLTNGTIMQPNNSITGWTTSIPPADFTGTIISNGIITTWNNGVVSFEVTPTGGIVTGGGGISEHLGVYTNYVADFVAPINFSGTYESTGSELAWDSAEKVTCTGTGYYLFVIRWAASTTGTAGAASTTFQIKRTSNNALLYAVDAGDGYAHAASYTMFMNTAFIAKLSYPFYVYQSGIASGTTLTQHGGTLTVTKLGAL